MRRQTVVVAVGGQTAVFLRAWRRLGTAVPKGHRQVDRQDGLEAFVGPTLEDQVAGDGGGSVAARVGDGHGWFLAGRTNL